MTKKAPPEVLSPSDLAYMSTLNERDRRWFLTTKADDLKALDHDFSTFAHSYDIDPHSYDIDPLEEGRAFKEQSLFACKQAAA